MKKLYAAICAYMLYMYMYVSDPCLHYYILHVKECVCTSTYVRKSSSCVRSVIGSAYLQDLFFLAV
jgi:hypothetical protein